MAGRGREEESSKENEEHLESPVKGGIVACFSQTFLLVRMTWGLGTKMVE